MAFEQGQILIIFICDPIPDPSNAPSSPTEKAIASEVPTPAPTERSNSQYGQRDYAAFSFTDGRRMGSKSFRIFDCIKRGTTILKSQLVCRVEAGLNQNSRVIPNTGAHLDEIPAGAQLYELMWN